MKNEFDRFDLNQYFDIQITASDTNLHKPFSRSNTKGN